MDEKWGSSQVYKCEYTGLEEIQFSNPKHLSEIVLQALLSIFSILAPSIGQIEATKYL